MKKLIYLFFTLMALMTVVSCEKVDLEGVRDEAGFVDLGLSVKWCAHNVGAGHPDQIGDYYTFADMLARFDNKDLPTQEQAEELLANCTLKRARINGVKGVLFTSKINGNPIFFPYGGFYLSQGEDRPAKFYDKGMTGYIWTKSDDTSLSEGWFLYLNQVFFDKEYPNGVQCHTAIWIKVIRLMSAL